MCIAIVKRIGGVITDEALKNSEDANPHGAGYAFVKDGHVVVKKGFFKIDEFIKAYREDEKMFGEDSPFMLHFRWATCGVRDHTNCHPFNFDHGALMHNGHFWTTEGDESDSNEFAKEVGQYLTKENVERKKLELEQMLNGNKVAILYPDKSFMILNEDLGRWDNDVWYSTDAYKTFTSWGPHGGGGAGGLSVYRSPNDRYSDILGY